MHHLHRFLLLLLLCLLMPYPALCQTGEPKLIIDQPEYNFSTVFTGTQINHTFKFRNAGTAPLIIEKVRHSCGCTASLISSKILAPGDSGEIKSTFDTTRFDGPVAKTIYVYSNDPNRKVIQLQMRGLIKEEITRHPSRVSFGSLVPETTSIEKSILVNRGKNQVFLENPQVTTPELTVSLSGRNLAPGESISVTIEATPKGNSRRLGGYVIIPLSGANLGEIRIPVYAEVTPLP